MKRVGSNLNLFLKSEKGNVIILVAFLLVFVLLGITALVVDVGYLYTQKRHLQNTADAAALAAAWELPFQNASIETTAKHYTKEHNIIHGIDNTEVLVSPSDGDMRKVKVEVTKNYSLFFALAPPIGETDADVYAMAVATKRMPGMDLLPFIMLEYTDFVEDKYRYHDYPNNNTPVYKIDKPGNLHPHDNAYDLVGDEHIEWGDWGNDLNDFLKMMCNFVTCGNRDVGKTVRIYKQGNQAGNWGIADFRPFSNWQGNQQGNPNQDSLQYVLKYGLDEPFCEDSNKTRTARPGYVSSIDNAVSADGMQLNERLERDKDEGFYVILLLPGPASEFQGNTDNLFSVNEIVIGYFKTLTLSDTGGNQYLVGYLTDVFICHDLDPSSWHNRVMLVE